MGHSHRQLRERPSLAGGYANCTLRVLAAPRHPCLPSPVSRPSSLVPRLLPSRRLKTPCRAIHATLTQWVDFSYFVRCLYTACYECVTSLTAFFRLNHLTARVTGVTIPSLLRRSADSGSHIWTNSMASGRSVVSSCPFCPVKCLVNICNGI